MQNYLCVKLQVQLKYKKINTKTSYFIRYRIYLWIMGSEINRCVPTQMYVYCDFTSHAIIHFSCFVSVQYLVLKAIATNKKSEILDRLFALIMLFDVGLISKYQTNKLR